MICSEEHREKTSSQIGFVSVMIHRYQLIQYKLRCAFFLRQERLAKRPQKSRKRPQIPANARKTRKVVIYAILVVLCRFPISSFILFQFLCWMGCLADHAAALVGEIRNIGWNAMGAHKEIEDNALQKLDVIFNKSPCFLAKRHERHVNF